MKRIKYTGYVKPFDDGDWVEMGETYLTIGDDEEPFEVFDTVAEMAGIPHWLIVYEVVKES